MKFPLSRQYCISKECDFEETSHKNIDGGFEWCPKCKAPMNYEFVKKDKKENDE